MWQLVCGSGGFGPWKLKPGGGVSPGCSSRREKSMERRRMRGVVPVLRRPSVMPRPRRLSDRPRAGASPRRPAWAAYEAHMDAPVKEGARGEEDMAAAEFEAQGRCRARDAAVFGEDVRHLVLPEGEARLAVERGLDRVLIGLAVHLGAGGAHGRPLAHVERAELDARGVGPEAHHAAEGVDLAHHVALGEAADGRIAGEVPEAVEVAAHEQHGKAQPRQGHGRFRPGVAAARHEAVEGRVRHGWSGRRRPRCGCRYAS